MTAFRSRSIFVVLGILLLISPSVSAAPKHRKIVAVNDFTGLSNVLRQGEGELLGDALREGLAGLSVEIFQMMTRENITEMLPPQKSLADCYQGQCEVEIGRRLGADYLVLGKVQKVDRQLVASVKLHRIQPVDVLLTRQIRAVTMGDLLNLVKGLGGEVKEALLKSESATQPGVKVTPPPPVITGPGAVLKFETTPPGAATSVDGQYLCSTPCKWKVPLGAHAIAFQKEGFKAQIKQLESVEDGQMVYDQLEPMMGTLHLSAVDDRTGDAMVADVYVDGRVVGATPFEGLVPVAAKKIEVAPVGMERRVVYATLMEGRTTKLALHFQSVAPANNVLPPRQNVPSSQTTPAAAASKTESITAGKTTSAPLVVEPPKIEAASPSIPATDNRSRRGISVSLPLTHFLKASTDVAEYPVGYGLEAMLTLAVPRTAKSDIQARAGLSYTEWHSTYYDGYADNTYGNYYLDLITEGEWRYSFMNKVQSIVGLGIGLNLIEAHSGGGSGGAGVYFNTQFGGEYRFTPNWSARLVDVINLYDAGGVHLQYLMVKIGVSYEFGR